MVLEYPNTLWSASGADYGALSAAFIPLQVSASGNTIGAGQLVRMTQPVAAWEPPPFAVGERAGLDGCASSEADLMTLGSDSELRAALQGRWVGCEGFAGELTFDAAGELTFLPSPSHVGTTASYETLVSSSNDAVFSFSEGARAFSVQGPGRAATNPGRSVQALAHQTKPDRAPLPAAWARHLGLAQAHARAARRAMRLDAERELAARALERSGARLDDARRLDVDRTLRRSARFQLEQALALLGELVGGALGGPSRRPRPLGRFSFCHLAFWLGARSARAERARCALTPWSCRRARR